MNTPKWLNVIVLVLALSMPATPVSAAPAASIALTSPTPNPALIGDEVSFLLVISATDITPGVAGAEVYVSYDPALVAPPASPLGVAVAMPDFFGISDISIKELLPAAQCPGGASPCVHLVLAGPAQTNHSGAAARFHFQGIATGSACFEVLASTLKDADGFDVPHTVAGPNPQCGQIVSRNVAGTVLRQGTPGVPNPGGGTLACSEVRLTSGGTTFGPVSTDGMGNFTLTNPPSGVQRLRAEYSGYLASEKTITISSGGTASTNVGTTTLRGGDVNGDNAINILDIGAIVSKFGNTGVSVRSDPADCTDTDEPADINDDSLVNISDLAIAAANWGLIGPTPWPL
jgi:hypothetical protein